MSELATDQLASGGVLQNSCAPLQIRTSSAGAPLCSVSVGGMPASHNSPCSQVCSCTCRYTKSRVQPLTGERVTIFPLGKQVCGELETKEGGVAQLRPEA